MNSHDLESGLGSGGGGGGASVLPLSLLSSSKASDVPRVRLLVLGDAGVGKSVLAARLGGATVSEIRANPYSGVNAGSTIGCQTECKLYEFKQTGAAASIAHGSVGVGSSSSHASASSSLHHRSVAPSASTAASAAATASTLFFLELWDVSGHRKYASSRDVFYTGVHGVLFVFDLMNRKSYENIRRWIREIVRVDRERGVEEKLSYEDAPRAHHAGRNSGGSRGGSTVASPQQSPATRPTPAPGQHHSTASLAAASLSSSSSASALGNLPVLIIGNKLDEYRARQKEQGVYESIKDYGVDSIYLSALDPKEDFTVLHRFYDQVITRRFFRSSSDSIRITGGSAFGHVGVASDGDGVGHGHTRRPAPFAARPASTSDRRSTSSEWHASSGVFTNVVGVGAREFTPPPIRSLSEFAIDVAGSPSSTSPVVLTPSSALDDPRFAHSYAFPDEPYAPITPTHANTALHVLTQQQQGHSRFGQR